MTVYQRRVTLGADIGNDNAQLVTSMVELMIKNKVDKGLSMDLEMAKNNNTYNVVFNGEKYLIGDRAETFSSETEGKNTQNHLMCFLVLLSKAVPTNSIIDVVLSESINKYFDNNHKQNIINRFQGEHKIEVNEETFFYKIDKVHILPEGMGHKLLNPSRYLNRTSYSVDLGSSTSIFIQNEGLIPLQSRSKSSNCGMHTLVANIKSELSKQDIVSNLTSQQVKEYIEYGSSNVDVARVVQEEKIKLLEKFNKEMESIINLKNHVETIEFVGGTSVILKKEIEEMYKTGVVIEDALWATARGNYTFAVQKFSR